MSIDYAFYSPKLDISAGYINKHYIDTAETLRFLLYCHLEGEKRFEIINDNDDCYCDTDVGDGAIQRDDGRLQIQAMYLLASRGLGPKGIDDDKLVRDFVDGLNNIIIRATTLQEISNILRFEIIQGNDSVMQFHIPSGIKFHLRKRLQQPIEQRWQASAIKEDDGRRCKICGSVSDHQMECWRDKKNQLWFVHADCKTILEEIIKEDNLSDVEL